MPDQIDVTSKKRATSGVKALASSARRPNRIPFWVAAARENAPRKFGFWNKQSPRLLELVNTLTGAEDLAPVWRALEKRLSAFKKWKNQKSPEAEEHVYVLAIACRDGLDGFVGYERASVRQRKCHAKKIANLAERLARQIEALQHPLFDVPAELDLRYFARQMGEEIFQANYENFGNNPDCVAGFHAGSFDYPQELARRLPELLDALALGASRWAQVPPSTLKPTLETAARLYFIRTLTTYFLDAYGDLMRDAVLSITGLFFDTSNMKKSDITECAPDPRMDRVNEKE